MELIEDPDDTRFAQFRVNERALASRSQKRDDTGAGLFLAEGDLVVQRALEAGCVPTAALVDINRVPDVAALLECPDVRRWSRSTSPDRAGRDAPVDSRPF